MEATYFFDPACPFTWRTSRWLVAVAPERDVTVRWRAFSLKVLNGDGIPEQYRAATDASFRALRLVEALRVDHREREAAEAAGVEDAKAVLDDANWDDAVRESHEKALALAGPGIGSPVLHVEGAQRGLHGPIIGAVPERDEALAIWDAVVPLS